jgi:hypothetical protein
MKHFGYNYEEIPRVKKILKVDFLDLSCPM